jgi:hypothetical protein
MFKKLQTFGCSLTSGDDIEDTKDTWPNVLSKNLHLKLENFSYSNASNQSISDKVVAKCDPDSLIIVCWTAQFRHQIYRDNVKIDYNVLTEEDQKVIAQNEEIQIMPKDLQNMISIQKKYINEDQYYKHFLQNVLWLQEYLKDQKIAYLFCYGNSMSISFNNKAWNVKPQMSDNLYNPTRLLDKFPFVKTIDQTYFLDFLQPQKSFWEHCVTNNFELGPTRHPLADGHKYWADYIYKHVEKLFNIKYNNNYATS